MTRGRSVPAKASSKESASRSSNDYSNSKAITAAIIPSPSISPNPTNGSVVTTRHNSKLLSNADTLARMTIELSVRAMSAQTERLEQNLSALMMCTKEDKEFRKSHDARLQSMYQEILVVKQRMEEIQGPEWNSKGNADLAKCKKDMDESIGQLRKEMGDLKGLVGDISCTLDKLPTVAEAEALISRTQVSTSSTKSGETKARPNSEKAHLGYKAAKTIKQRIEDTISSTRRWNRDHKITKLKDASFITNYLKQQSKRDPQMAVYIQKRIQRRVYRSGRPKSKTRPRNLEQFCQNLVWKDVLDTAEDILVKNGGRTAKALE
ncbi:hypothetical protein ACHAQJ_007460 [Trichoderma viride]